MSDLGTAWNVDQIFPIPHTLYSHIFQHKQAIPPPPHETSPLSQVGLSAPTEP